MNKLRIKINKTQLILFAAFFTVSLPQFFGSLELSTLTNIIFNALPLAAMVLFYWYSRRRVVLLEKRSGTMQLMVVLWTAFIGVSLLRNHDISAGTIRQIEYYIMLYVMMLCIVRRTGWVESAWKVIRLYTMFHLIIGLFLLLNQDILRNKVVPLLWTEGSVMRILQEAIQNRYMTGLFNHYSAMGMCMATGVIAYSTVLFQKKKTKIWQWIALASMVLGLFLTGKRGPLIFTIAAVGLVYVLTEKIYTQKGFSRIMKRCILFVILVAFAYALVPQVRSVFDRLFADADSVNSYSSGRIEYHWIYAIALFLDSPIIGKGWRGVRYLVPEMTGRSANDAHNIYLQVLAETGIVGAVIIFGFFICAWKSAYKAMRLQDKRKMLSESQECILKISLLFQTFFLLYGITGNPLYDVQCFVPYFISCTVGFACYMRLKARRNDAGGTV